MSSSVSSLSALDQLHLQVMGLIDGLNVYQQREKIGEMERICFESLSHRLYSMAYLLMLNRAERDGDMSHQDAVRERSQISFDFLGSESLVASSDDFYALESQVVVLAKKLKTLFNLDGGEKKGKNMPQQHWQQIEAAFTNPSQIAW